MIQIDHEKEQLKELYAKVCAQARSMKLAYDQAGRLERSNGRLAQRVLELQDELEQARNELDEMRSKYDKITPEDFEDQEAGVVAVELGLLPAEEV